MASRSRYLRNVAATNAGQAILSLVVEDEEAVRELAQALAPMLAPLLVGGAVDDPWLTTAEAAVHLRCKPQRVHNLKYQRRLIPDGYDGDRPLYRRSTLDAYLMRSADRRLASA